MSLSRFDGVAFIYMAKQHNKHMKQLQKIHVSDELMQPIVSCFDKPAHCVVLFKWFDDTLFFDHHRLPKNLSANKKQTFYIIFNIKRFVSLERVMGIEPTHPAWKAGTLPLSHTRVWCGRRDSNSYACDTRT